MSKEISNPAPDWISERVWLNILTMPSLLRFATFADEFAEHIDGFKRIFDSSEPHKYVHVLINI